MTASSQLELFATDDRHTATATTPVPRQRGSETSAEGAVHIKREVTGLRRLVLDALEIAGTGGLTRQELAIQVSTMRGRTVKETTICGRIAELREMGLVIENGITRIGNAGVRCEVLVHIRYA